MNYLKIQLKTWNLNVKVAFLMIQEIGVIYEYENKIEAIGFRTNQLSYL